MHGALVGGARIGLQGAEAVGEVGGVADVEAELMMRHADQIKGAVAAFQDIGVDVGIGAVKRQAVVEIQAGLDLAAVVLLRRGVGDDRRHQTARRLHHVLLLDVGVVLVE
ncbi:hypothetical protein D3C73_1174510 [compost metagenome]